MKIMIPGGSGQIGALLARGDEVVILASTPKVHAQKQLKSVAWDGRTLGAWTREIDEAELIINLAGRTVDCRYSARDMQQMLDSRDFLAHRNRTHSQESQSGACALE
jgi:hypothetical protein